MTQPYAIVTPASTFWPHLEISIEDTCSFDLEMEKFGQLEKTRDLVLPPELPSRAKRFVLLYEELLRRLFKECTSFDNEIHVQGDTILLNAIEAFPSLLIVEFLRRPTKERYLILNRILRKRYCTRPDVVAIIVARGLGVRATRFAGEQECELYWHWLGRSAPCTEMSAAGAITADWLFTKAQFVKLETDPPIILLGQTGASTPGIMMSFLRDKSAASAYLRALGFTVPEQALICSPADLPPRIRCAEVILKPVMGSNRVGVIGPIAVDQPGRLLACFQRCLAQIDSGPQLVLAEQYVRGTHVRINVSHGCITFVARSIRNEVLGDGRSSIRELLLQRRRASGTWTWVSDTLIENTIMGLGRSLDEILRDGEILPVSHDGNEEGSFADITDEFPIAHQATAVRISEALRCPVLGIDAIIDSRNQMWIIEVNAERAASGFFPDPRRSYETMERLVRAAIQDSTRHVEDYAPITYSALQAHAYREMLDAKRPELT